ncbi:DoxX family protein [Haliscomenobacter sp.]|uniref:DoxX family protein n=1 Tax=Haliscomenobacter sp. TaxID=2717303 RepID=UPI00359400F0
MSLLNFCVFISSLSFFAYGISYFFSPHMQSEFKRFGLERIGILTIVLELLGAAGLLFGLVYNPILVLSSGGLALLMFFGVLVRIKSKDSLFVSLPALFLMGLNLYIFIVSIK